MYQPRKDFSHIKEKIQFIEQFLTNNKISVNPGSPFETVFLLAEYLESSDFPQKCNEQKLDIDEAMSMIMGTYHIANLISDLHDKKGFDVLSKHLKYFGSSLFMQNVKALIDDGANKMFELMLALGLFALNQDLAIDDPQNSKGDNPDILIELRGQKWGFACKVLNGNNIKSLFDAIEKGVDQIEKSDADIGIVVLNLKNKINHDDLLPQIELAPGEKISGCFMNWTEPTEMVHESVEELTINMFTELEPKNVLNLFTSKKALPGLLVFNQYLTAIEVENIPMYSIQTFLQLIPFTDRVEWSKYKHIFSEINDVFHNIYPEERRQSAI